MSGKKTQNVREDSPEALKQKLGIDFEKILEDFRIDIR